MSYSKLPFMAIHCSLKLGIKYYYSIHESNFILIITSLLSLINFFILFLPFLFYFFPNTKLSTPLALCLSFSLFLLSNPPPLFLVSLSHYGSWFWFVLRWSREGVWAWKSRLKPIGVLFRCYQKLRFRVEKVKLKLFHGWSFLFKNGRILCVKGERIWIRLWSCNKKFE